MILQVVKSMLTAERIATVQTWPLELPEILQWLLQASPVSADILADLDEWADKTPTRAALRVALESEQPASPKLGMGKKVPGKKVTGTGIERKTKGSSKIGVEI